MGKQQVILFDIDYTLFNARIYRDTFLQKIFQALEYPDWDKFLEIEDELYRENKKLHGYFEPVPFLQALEKKFQKKLPFTSLERLFTDEEIIEQSLYSETKSVLKKLAERQDIILGIFSAGREHMQRAKIKQVREFLHEEHIHIFAFNKKQALDGILHKYQTEHIFLIDDILEILYNAKKLRSDVTTVWIKRGPYINRPEVQEQIDKDGFLPDYTIENLEQILEIVEK